MELRLACQEYTLLEVGSSRLTTEDNCCSSVSLITTAELNSESEDEQYIPLNPVSHTQSTVHIKFPIRHSLTAWPVFTFEVTQVPCPEQSLKHILERRKHF